MGTVHDILGLPLSAKVYQSGIGSVECLLGIIKGQAPGQNHDTAGIFTLEPAEGVLLNRSIRARGSIYSGDGRSRGVSDLLERQCSCNDDELVCLLNLCSESADAVSGCSTQSLFGPSALLLL